MKLRMGWRLWVLIILLIISLIAISPTLKKGVLVKSVETNSSAYLAGLRASEIVKEFNSAKINNIGDYADQISKLNDSISNKIVIRTEKKEYVFLEDGKPEIVVVEIPKSKLKAGFDLKGGSRALVKPEIKVSEDELSDLISIIENRFNVYGLADVRVRPVTDLSGERFVLIEVPGATPRDLADLIGSQGKFEAKIGDDVVFIGGKRDITSVCRLDPSCAGIRQCNPNGQTFCEFQFSVFLSEDAANRHANITSTLEINLSTSTGGYLSKTLDLYVDDKLVDSLQISETLRGIVATQVVVSGSGIGTSREDAIKDAQANMNRLQTILITGSLTFKLEIVKLDSVSPIIGEQITRNILFVSLLAFLAVVVVIFIRYRQIKFVLPILFTMLSEVVIILGVAALIKWNLDLASIAGILGAIGTGVDDQIVILDEARLGRIYGWKERMKRAFFIILGAYLTVFVAMLPLAWAGAGLLKGFAITTIIGITAGVFITRPAFAEIVEKIAKE